MNVLYRLKEIKVQCQVECQETYITDNQMIVANVRQCRNGPPKNNRNTKENRDGINTRCGEGPHLMQHCEKTGNGKRKDGSLPSRQG